jgi:nicotinate-nucleotide adenylyltransferase
MSDQFEKCRELGNCFEFMPDSDGKHFQSELPKLFLKHEIKDSVTFFGGTFNPFHEGHRACLDLCPEKNILIIPDRNPYKKTPIQEGAYDEVLALAKILEKTPYSIYPGFLAKKEGNPTAHWLPRVKIAEKNFLMGDDSFMNLLLWNEPATLLRALTKLYVVPRDYDRSLYADQSEKLKALNPKLQIIILPDHPHKTLSSTKLRSF